MLCHFLYSILITLRCEKWERSAFVDKGDCDAFVVQKGIFLITILIKISDNFIILHEISNLLVF